MVGAVGCSLLIDLDGFAGDARVDTTCDGAPCLEASLDGGRAGTDGAGADGDGDGAQRGCPSGRGATMVQVQNFCIDTTEATVAHYQQFLTDMSNLTDRGLSAQPAKCSWNDTFTPSYWWPAFPSESALSPAEVAKMPVGVVDWCDAHAFCQWAGKRLCGAVDGGAVGPSDVSGTKSEWYVACSHNDATQYPYGPAYTAGTCNDNHDGGLQQRAPVGSFQGCTGGYPGLNDMSGNAEEWIDSCTSTTNADAAADMCAANGGAWFFPPAAVDCKYSQTQTRDSVGQYRGIRCCATP